jgi:hypothetical protein
MQPRFEIFSCREMPTFFPTFPLNWELVRAFPKILQFFGNIYGLRDGRIGA